MKMRHKPRMRRAVPSFVMQRRMRPLIAAMEDWMGHFRQIDQYVEDMANRPYAFTIGKPK